MILPRKTKTYARQSGPGICTSFPPTSGRHCVKFSGHLYVNPMLRNHLTVQSCFICIFATWRFITAITTVPNKRFEIFAATSRIRSSKLLDSIFVFMAEFFYHEDGGGRFLHISTYRVFHDLWTLLQEVIS